MEQSQPTKTPPLRVGLLVDGVMASHHVHDFVKWAATRPRVAITHLIVHSPAEVGPKSGSQSGLTSRLIQQVQRPLSKHGLYFALSELLFRCVVAFERRLIARNRHHAAFLHEYDLSPFVQSIVRIVPIVSKSGFVCSFHAADIEKIVALDLDLLVRCGDRIPRGDILKASRLGVLSFHHADNRINRGGPAGFWEVYHRQETTGFTLQRLTEELDAGDVLMRGRFGTQHYYLLNKAFLFEKSNYYLKLLVEKIANTGRLPDFLPKNPSSNPLYRNPRALELMSYFARYCYNTCLKRIRRLLGIAYRWNVAYVYRNWNDAEYWRGILLKNPSFRFLADPFVILKNGRPYCFAEELDCRKERGSIVAYELTREGGVRVGTALEEDFHLSFPYIFEYEQQLYMCPEASESRSIRIYRCIEFPLRWKLEVVAMDGVSAVDSMIFEKGGKWWMFTNIDPAAVGDHSSELFIFYADSPLTNDWKPHSLNPVVVDASYARNAGFLRDGGDHFRCSQQRGFDFFGKSVQINRIVELTETNFVERRVSVRTPSFAAGVVGTHHLHCSGNITVFDFSKISRLSAGVGPSRTRERG